MNCSRISNRRETDLDEESHLSHDDHSDHDEEIKECDSADETGNLNASNLTGTSGLEYGNNSSIRGPTPDLNSDIPLGHHSQFPPNHPLGALGNFMGLGLHNIPNLQHGDVLEKLKMQVRDMKGMMDQDYPPHPNFPPNLATPPNTAFSLPPNGLGGFGPPPHNLSQSSHQHQQSSHSNGFSFTSPILSKDANPASNSSTSSEASNSSQQNNGWSFEEQYKQVRQLYEINDDPKRKEFLDDLFSFMQKRGTPINRLPIMAKSVLDLYELYNLVIARGGLVDVINKKLWQEIIKGLHLPSSITSAAFTLRTQYMKYLYPYECEKKNLSSPSELQAAIDGNRREGRRTSYGQFENMSSHLQMSQMPRNGLPGHMNQMSPLALVAHAQNQTPAHRMMPPPLGQVPNLVSHELEQRMMEYIKIISNHNQKEARRPLTPEISQKDALTALELSRVALWSMYNNNQSPPESLKTSPQGVEPQREALNLSESPPNISIKRERPIEPPSHDGIHHQLPKKLKTMSHNNEPQFRNPVTPPQLPPPQPSNHLMDDVDNGDEEGEVEDDNHDRHSEDNLNDLHGSDHRNISSTSLINGHHNNSKDDKDHIHHLPQTSTVSSIGKQRTSNSPLSSPIKESHHHHHHHLHNGRGHQSSGEEIPLINGMQFKITRKGNNGGQQLVINLEINGIHYEGVLYANPISNSSATATPPLNTSPNTSGNSSTSSTNASSNNSNIIPTTPITSNSNNRTSSKENTTSLIDDRTVSRSLVSS